MLVQALQANLQCCQDAGDSACLMSLVSLDVICPVMALASFGIHQATLRGLLNLGFKRRCHKRQCLDLIRQTCRRELMNWLQRLHLLTSSFLHHFGQGSHEWLKKSYRHIGIQTGAQAPWTKRRREKKQHTATVVLHILKLPVIERQTTKAPLGIRNDGKVTTLLFTTFGWIAVDQWTWWILDLKLANPSSYFQEAGSLDGNAHGSWCDCIGNHKQCILGNLLIEILLASHGATGATAQPTLMQMDTAMLEWPKKMQFPTSKYLPLDWLQCAAAIFACSRVKYVSLRASTSPTTQPWLNRGSSDWWVKALMISPKASSTVKLLRFYL